VTYDNDLNCKKGISVRIAKALASLMALEKLWKSKSVSLQIKLSVLKTSIYNSMLGQYACETLVLTKNCERKMLAFERKSFRKSCERFQQATNDYLCRKVQSKINLLQEVIQRKLQLLGLVFAE